MQHRQVFSMSNSACVVALLAWLCCLQSPSDAAARPRGRADQWLCAPGCWCSQDGLSAECEGVTPEPASLPQELVALSLRAHQLREVRNDTFAFLPGLQQLDLSDGRISEVMAGAFETLPRLRSLSLSNNELTFLAANAFSANQALEALDLSSNPLVLPSIGPFLRSSSLRELNLAVCGLQRFTPDTFTHFPSLLSLDLAFNSLSELTAEEVEPFMDLSWLRVDADALSEDAMAFLQVKGVQVEILELVNTTSSRDLLSEDQYDTAVNITVEGDLQPEEQYDAAEGDLQPEDQDDVGGGMAIFLGLLDRDYRYEEDVLPQDYEGVKISDAVYEPESEWVYDLPQTGASETAWRQRWARHPSWKLVLYSVMLVSTTCVTAALAYWATVLVIRRRRSTQAPRDTLNRAFRQVATLSAYKQLQRQPAKDASGQGYRRLYNEEETLPPRAERCSCLSCSEPVPTQPCIRFYEGPASVHGVVPSQYYTLSPTYNQ